MNLARRSLLLAALALPLAAHAQQSPGGTVTGIILCADTNAPARFAKVLLKSVTPNNSFGDGFIGRMQKMAAQAGGDAAKPPTDEEKRSLAAASKMMNQATDMLSSSTVGLDGAFTFTGVKPGTYYVHALFAGYVDPLSQFSDEDLASTDPDVRARIAVRIPTITITGTESTRTSLRLERGAAISGRILFNDASPAAGWIITAAKPQADEDPADATAAIMNQALAMSGNAIVAKTDDLGRYRVSGLSAGKYVLRASLTATSTGVTAGNISQNGSGISLVVYSGNTFTRAEAKSFSLGSGEELTGMDLTVQENHLHNITGHVYSKSDSHALNSGNVVLTVKGSTGLPHTAAIRDDGSFRFDYLPSGPYILTVTDAADARVTGTNNLMGMSIPKTEVLHKYGMATTDVTLADVDLSSISFNVEQTNWTPPVKKPGEKDPDLGDVLGALFSSDDKDDKKDGSSK